MSGADVMLSNETTYLPGEVGNGCFPRQSVKRTGPFHHTHFLLWWRDLLGRVAVLEEIAPFGVFWLRCYGKPRQSFGGGSRLTGRATIQCAGSIIPPGSDGRFGF